MIETDLTLFEEPYRPRFEVLIEFSDLEKQQVLRLIENLLILHGKAHDKRVVGALAAAICTANIPYKNIVAGIHWLQDQDEVRSITIGILKMAARRTIGSETATDTRIDCRYCNRTGLVELRRDNPGKDFHDYRSAFACACENGGRSRGLVRWNGLDVQISRDVTFMFRSYTEPA